MQLKLRANAASASVAMLFDIHGENLLVDRSEAAAFKRDHRIVIVGGGAGGLELATRLSHHLNFSRVTLIDREASHFWKPRLHEVAAGRLGASEGGTSYLAQATAKGFSFVMGAMSAADFSGCAVRVAAVKDPATGAVVLAERNVQFDSLVLCIGSRVNDFGIAGVPEYCHFLDTVRQAAALQRQLLEQAIRVASGVLDRVRIGIVGAGATGVELAAEIHQTIRDLQMYGGLDTKLEITLVDRAPRVLPSTHPETSAYAMRKLEEMGVVCRLGQSVQRVSEDAIELGDGTRIPCELKVWASGIIGHDLVASLNRLRCNKGRRIEVDSALKCVGLPDVYAFGDCAAGTAGAAYPATAQCAHQQASYLAQSFERRARQAPVPPFHYRALGTLVSLSENDAAGEFPVLKMQRRPWLMQGVISKFLYGSLQFTHRMALNGLGVATALWLADWLRRTSLPPVKLH